MTEDIKSYFLKKKCINIKWVYVSNKKKISADVLRKMYFNSNGKQDYF